MRAAEGDGADASRLLIGAICVAAGTVLCALALQSVLVFAISAESLMSNGLWRDVVGALVGRMNALPDGSLSADVGFTAVLVRVVLAAGLSWLGGAAWIARRTGVPLGEAAARWGMLGWAWWIIGGSWELARLAAFLIGSHGLEALVLSGPTFWIALAAAGWLATLLGLGASASLQIDDAARSRMQRDDYRAPPTVWLCYGAYVVIFVAMNWQLYRGLRLPHGDSAMYEEHLWNLLHGKGFRSYLDQGPFLGEHVQVIHLFLIPLYVLWPSQILLELCGSAILAAGCLPVYWIARRHTGDGRSAAWLAAAYLLYFPMQYLDIAVDLKTFRPNGLGIPALLFALDQLERRRYKTFCVLLAVTLTAQEDYAIVLAPLGVWIALRQAKSQFALGAEANHSARPMTVASAGAGAEEGRDGGQGAAPGERIRRLRTFWFGALLAILSVVYLVIATRVVMAWFRGWQEIHYAGYFSKFGKSLPEIAWSIFTRPRLFWDSFVTANSGIYALALLAPVGFLSLFSPGRLAVALPLFVTLCLNEVIREPRHHVHAAAIPFVFWSAAAGLEVASRWAARVSIASRRASAADARAWLARFACFSALVTGAFIGLSPLSVSFWDRSSEFYWGTLYVPGRRAELFERVERLIPPDARVASTDFVHPRFTHRARSYDYSDYRRAVSHYEARVPEDTDYIVIDCNHPYSTIKRPDQVAEYRVHPDQWELLSVPTEGYFIVLRRKGIADRSASANSTP